MIRLFICQFGVHSVLSIIIPEFMHHRMHDVFLPGTHFQVVTSIIVLIAILMINLLCRIPIIKKMFCDKSMD